MRAVVLLMLACGTIGCSYGMTAGKFRPAQGPQGVMVRLFTDRAMYRGELLETRETGLVVLTDQVVRLIPYVAIVTGQVDQLGDSLVRGRTAPNSAVRNRLRLVSRFPNGLEPELLVHLLSEHGQTELAGVGP